MNFSVYVAMYIYTELLDTSVVKLNICTTYVRIHSSTDNRIIQNIGTGYGPVAVGTRLSRLQ